MDEPQRLKGRLDLAIRLGALVGLVLMSPATCHGEGQAPDRESNAAYESSSEVD